MDPRQAAAAAFQPPPQPPPSSAVVHPNPATNHPQPLASHPSYTEMIMAAIMWANSQGKNGSSKRSIAKYINGVYTELPPTHSALLTHHLIRLKETGQLVMVGKAYQIPGHVPEPAPLALTPAQVLAQIPIRVQPDTGTGTGTGTVNGVKRPRGRPRKVVEEGVMRRSGRLSNHNVGGGGGGDGGGDGGDDGGGGDGEVVVREVAVVETVEEKKRRRGWPKGKPRWEGVRAYTGKPRGRPRKYPQFMVNRSSEQGRDPSKDLLKQLEEMRLKIRDVVGVVRPYLASQNASDALTALQELEELSTAKSTATLAVAEPPVNLTSPPPASTTAPENFDSATGNLTAPTTSVSATPAINAPIPFESTVTPLLHTPSSVNNRDPVNWIPSN